MEFGIGTYGLGYLAGTLSTLSPCVLPLIPIILATAISAHRFGALALAAGLTLSFTALGFFLATIGASLGIEQTAFRTFAAVLLIAFAIMLLSPRLQERFATATSGISAAGNMLLAKFSVDGLLGQFIVGLILGVIWTPCIGPTLGAATTLASQGTDLPQIALLMFLFGIGAGTPILAFGLASRTTVLQLRGKVVAAGQIGKTLLGTLLLLLGLAILTGFDKTVEAWLLSVMPEWLNELSTRY